jgi:hypothetical protein
MAQVQIIWSSFLEYLEPRTKNDDGEGTNHHCLDVSFEYENLEGRYI